MLWNPQAISHESFRRIRARLGPQLESMGDLERQVAMRVVHSGGRTALAARLRFSPDACAAGLAALGDGAPIFCDAMMVRHGLGSRWRGLDVHCPLGDGRTGRLARRLGCTRSAAALHLWRRHLGGSVVLIGNAPTALFWLLELLRRGTPAPALVVAMPPGFVGARESKAALWRGHRRLGVQCITMLGQQGGSAVCAAAANALLHCLHGERF